MLTWPFVLTESLSLKIVVLSRLLNKLFESVREKECTTILQTEEVYLNNVSLCLVIKYTKTGLGENDCSGFTYQSSSEVPKGSLNFNSLDLSISKMIYIDHPLEEHVEFTISNPNHSVQRGLKPLFLYFISLYVMHPPILSKSFEPALFSVVVHKPFNSKKIAIYIANKRFVNNHWK